jgi:hypothetical protein
MMLTGVDAAEHKIVTPAELERRGADVDLVKVLTETPSTAPKLRKLAPHEVASRFGDQ